MATGSASTAHAHLGAPSRVPARRAAVRALAVVLLLALMLGGGWYLLRDSSFVAVDDVTVTGVSGQQAHAIEAALTTAAHDMTTLHVREDKLRTAVASYPVVGNLVAKADFPHGLTIDVRERSPVAALRVHGRSIPVAADGALLRGLRAKGLPSIPLRATPGGHALTDPLALAMVRIVAAAPQALRARVTKALAGSRGLAVQLRDGPVVAFGAPDRLVAKWMALTAVLASPASAGGSLIDLGVPEHPAVVGLPPLSGDDTGGVSVDPSAPATAVDGTPAGQSGITAGPPTGSTAVDPANP